jgi:hypothetical protein
LKDDSPYDPNQGEDDAPDDAPEHIKSHQLREGQINQKKALEECNFDSDFSINEYYPPRKGKGSLLVPRVLIDACATREAKARCINDWRAQSSKQQYAKRKELDNQQPALQIQPRPQQETAPAPPKKISQLERYQQMMFDPDCDLTGEEALDTSSPFADRVGGFSKAFEAVLRDVEENDDDANFSPGRLTTKQLRKQVTQDKANKKKALKRKQEAENKVKCALALCTCDNQFTLTVHLLHRCLKGCWSEK